jgi:hypothetical protein
LIYGGGENQSHSQARDPNDPDNWRLITLTSIIDRIIFGSIDQIISSYGTDG